MEKSNKGIVEEAFSKAEIIEQLNQLGLQSDMTVEVHSSFAKVGYVIGGPAAFNDALLQIVGEKGNIVMPCQDYYNTEPLFWQNPPVKMNLADKIRENMPGYDIYTSGHRLMGVLVDDIRSRKTAYHSYHPNCAFVAIGKDSKYLMSNQPLSFPLGMKSPLGKLYQLDNSYTLLIGCDYDNCTSWHLAEHLSMVRGIILQGGCIKKGGKNIWKKYLDYEVNSDEFIEIGRQYEKTAQVRIGKVGNAVCKFFKTREAIDFACGYLLKKYER
ncbi:MAG: aminoglycoside N(3)-acetyltransferase [Erysipelotrichaceae bacterium]